MDGSKQNICELCAGSNLTAFSPRSGLDYVICNMCKHCIQDMDQSSIDALFSASQEKYFGISSQLLSVQQNFLEAEATHWHHKLIKRGLEVGSDLLEVGPGNGALAQLAVKLGYKVTLVEESELLAKNLKNIVGVKVINRNFEESKIASNSYDIFCSFHVIEHVSDVHLHLREALRVIRPGGLAFIATPNANSWQQRFFRGLSPNFDSAHIRVFSEASINDLARKTGWRVLKSTTPEYTSGWLRVISKILRKFRAEDEELTAGKYANMSSSKMDFVMKLISITTWPFRNIQTFLRGGNEAFLILQKPECTTSS